MVGLRLRKGRAAEEEGGGEDEDFSWFTDDDG